MSALLREGDIVTVNGVVASSPLDFDGTPKVRVRIEPYHEIFVLVSDVIVVKPDFRIGDRVCWNKPGFDQFEGDVLSISGEHLWVLRDCGEFATVWIGKATRLDPKSLPEPDSDEVEEAPPAAEPTIVMQHTNIASPAPLDGKVGSEEEV